MTILYSNPDHEVRQVRLNQQHPVIARRPGTESVGHYEGEHAGGRTVGVKVDRPFAMVDIFGKPYSKSLHVVERYTLLDYEAAKAAQEPAKGKSRDPSETPA